jgi:hypothetical protein
MKLNQEAVMALQLKNRRSFKSRNPFIVVIGGRSTSEEGILSLENDRFLKGHYLGNQKSNQQKEGKQSSLRLINS